MNANVQLLVAQLSRLEALIERRFDRLEQRLKEVAQDVDTIDRALRPYGDGTKLPPRRRRY